jgi:hypothetical protein
LNAQEELNNLLGTVVKVGNETKSLAELTGISEISTSDFKRAVSDNTIQAQRTLGEAANVASERRLKLLKEELAVQGNLNLDELLDTIALQNRISTLTSQTPGFAAQAPISSGGGSTSVSSSSSSSGGVTINISGQFMGSEAEALEWAKKIDEQLVVLDRTNQRVSV